MRVVERIATALILVVAITLIALMVRDSTSAPGDEQRVARSSADDTAASGETNAPAARRDPSTPEPVSASASAEPTPEPNGPALFTEGDEGDDVRRLQARLREIYWFNRDVTGYYGPVTAESVRGFQAKREIPATGVVDRQTMDRLLAMTSEPSREALQNRIGRNDPGTLDTRCTSGDVLCIDKTSQTLRWVVDGDVRTTVDVRFGAVATPTREGVFSVYVKSRDHVSSLYDSAMPYAMFFDGGQAVHYSSDFAARGYNGASHGCVNVRDRDAVASLFDQVELGDKVVVYRS